MAPGTAPQGLVLAAPGAPCSEHDVLPNTALPWLWPVVLQQWPLARVFLEGKGALGSRVLHTRNLCDCRNLTG